MRSVTLQIRAERALREAYGKFGGSERRAPSSVFRLTVDEYVWERSLPTISSRHLYGGFTNLVNDNATTRTCFEISRLRIDLLELLT